MTGNRKTAGGDGPAPVAGPAAAEEAHGAAGAAKATKAATAATPVAGTAGAGTAGAVTGDEATDTLLARFAEALRPPLVPLTALWLHGSAAEGGDYLPGRSDLDLIAVLTRPCTPAEERALVALHRRLVAEVPLARGLHCSYLPADRLGDPALDHPVWAHREYYSRPVTPVTRAELHRFGRVLYGRPVAGLLPPVTDGQLAAFLLDELREGLGSLAGPRRHLLLQQGWLDHALYSLPRILVTLRDGRLITKREALDVLAAEPDVPAELVADLRRRRYGTGGDGNGSPTGTGEDPDRERRVRRRADLAADFLGPAVERLLAAYSPAAGTEAAAGRGPHPATEPPGDADTRTGTGP
jgi:hypothetical protein